VEVESRVIYTALMSVAGALAACIVCGRAFKVTRACLRVRAQRLAKAKATAAAEADAKAAALDAAMRAAEEYTMAKLREKEAKDRELLAMQEAFTNKLKKVRAGGERGACGERVRVKSGE